MSGVNASTPEMQNEHQGWYDSDMVGVTEEEVEEEKQVFSINTAYSRCERFPVKEVWEEMDWVEARGEENGALFWFIDACSGAQRKMMKHSSAFFNRYPRFSIICMKREFHILMKKYQTLFPEDYDFIPETYILPEDYKAYKRYLDTKKNAVLLAKPSKGRGGQGIFFVKNAKELDQECINEYAYVAQQYIANPFLIENKKFDFRLYLMIKGVEEMEAYIAFEGLVRFWTEEYVGPKVIPDQEPNEDEDGVFGLNQDNLMGHLTNFSLNKESEKFVNNQNFKESDDGTKRLLSSVLKVLESKGLNIDKFKEEIKSICSKLVYSLRPYIVNTYHTEIGLDGQTNQNWFHLLGLDIMIDADHKWWVLEINWFPSFNYFIDRIMIDPKTKKRIRTKQVSELDRYLKKLLIKEAVLIIKGEGELGTGVYEKVFPPEKNEDDYQRFAVHDDIRKIFEGLCSNHEESDYQYINLDQFESLREKGGLKYQPSEKVTIILRFLIFAHNFYRELEKNSQISSKNLPSHATGVWWILASSPKPLITLAYKCTRSHSLNQIDLSKLLTVSESSNWVFGVYTFLNLPQ